MNRISLALALSFAISLPGAAYSDNHDSRGHSRTGLATLEAAATDNLKVRMKLATMLLTGNGLERDIEGAISHYRKAAEQDVAFAQHRLARLYLEGEVVEQDYAQAFVWLLRAAELGYVEAQLDLSQLYEDGKGIGQSYVNAHKWLDIAASLADLDIEARQSRLEANMSFLQLAQARYLSASCILKDYQHC